MAERGDPNGRPQLLSLAKVRKGDLAGPKLAWVDLGPTVTTEKRDEDLCNRSTSKGFETSGPAILSNELTLLSLVCMALLSAKVGWMACEPLSLPSCPEQRCRSLIVSSLCQRTLRTQNHCKDVIEPCLQVVRYTRTVDRLRESSI